MKIFLNNRTIQFTTVSPENVTANDLVVNYESQEQLMEVYVEFERYERYQKLWIIDRGPGFKVFSSFFKYIPAAGGLVKNENGDYLFIHRLGHWDLPKGKIDKTDIRNNIAVADQYSCLHSEEEEILPHPAIARTCALREVREETGLKSVSITRDLPSTQHIYLQKDKRILKQTWWFEMSASSDQPLKPQTSEGIFLVKWTPPRAIHCILTHTYASIRELLLEVMF